MYKYGDNERAYFDIVKYQDKYRAIDIDKDFTIQQDSLKELEKWLMFNVPNYRINNYDEYIKLIIK